MPIKYISYTPNTVEGQAVLDNITRTQRVLRYRDNDKVISKILRGMPYYEVEKQEQIGKESDNLVIRGECLSACAYLKEQGIKVDLVYIDPPFASGADYAKKVYIRKNPKLAEKVKKVEEELGIEGLKAFEETMYGDIWKKEDYLNWMYENLIAIKSIMSDTGSIYVHLDWHVGHYVKILMDEIFGEDNFTNEIIWKRKTGTANSQNTFGNQTDNIFLYSKSNKYIYKPTFRRNDIPEDVIEKKFNKVDENSKKYWSGDLGSPNLRENLKYDYKGYKPPKNGWAVKIDIMKKWDEEGKLIFPKSKGGRIRRKMFLDEWAGFPVQNLWDDISPVQSQSKEKVYNSYATQKPEALLQRIIKASSNKNMVIADFFGGSGVTAKVAHDLDRKFIHCDIGINSIQTTRDRLVAAGASFQILEIQDGVSLFRNPQQTMDKLAKLIPGLQQKVAGLGKFWFGALQDSKLGTIPVYVPNLIDGSEKVLDIPTINRIINEELQNLEMNVQKAVVYYVDVDDRQALEKFIKDNNPTITKIELRDLKALLHNIVVEDEVSIMTKKTKEGYTIAIEKFVSDRLQQKINAFNEKGNLQSIKKGKKFTPISISEEGLELIEYLSVDAKNEEGVWTSSTEIKIDKLGYISIGGKKTKEFWDGTIQTKEKPKRLKVRNISGDETVLAIG